MMGASAKKKIGLRIRRQRKSLGQSQQALAAVVGVHINTVARWELTGVDPNHKDMPFIAGALQCSVAWLTGDSSKSPLVPSEGTLRELLADPQLPLFHRDVLLRRRA